MEEVTGSNPVSPTGIIPSPRHLLENHSKRRAGYVQNRRAKESGRSALWVMVRIVWPPQPTLIDPRRFPDAAAAIAQLFARAHIVLAALKAHGE